MNNCRALSHAKEDISHVVITEYTDHLIEPSNYLSSQLVAGSVLASTCKI